MAVIESASYGGTGSLAVATPPNMAFIGPGLSYWIVPNGSGGQFAGLNLPPVSFSPSDQGQTVDVGFVDAANATVQLSAMNPQVAIQSNGRVSLKGISAALAQSISVTAEIMGRQADRTGYLVVSVTNNGGGALSLKSVVLSLLNVHLAQSRYYTITAATGDAYSYDTTNKLLALTNSGVTNLATAIASNFGAFSTTQHYQVADSAINPLTQITGSGALADTASATATASKYAYLAIGDNANQVSIGAGATAQFVFILVAGASTGAAATLIAAAKSGYAADITTYTGYASTTRLQSFSSAPHVDFLLDYLQCRELYRYKNQKASGGQTFIPAGAYTFFNSFTRDTYQGAYALSQIGATLAAKDSYALRIATQAGDFSQYHQISDLLNATGIYQSNARNGTPGDQDFFTVLTGYEYYLRTQDSTWLTANIASINNILTMLQNWYNGVNGKSSDNAFVIPGVTTYMDAQGNVTGNSTMVSPYANAILIYALRAGVELNTAAGNASQAATWTTWRTTLLTAMTALWNSGTSWPVFNKTQDGTGVYTNPHLMQVDCLIYDAITDSTRTSAMAAALASSTYWNAATLSYNMLPTTDPNYGAGSYWDGYGWHLSDYKATSAMVRYGTTAQAQTAWARLKSQVQRVRDNNAHQPGEHVSNIGQFSFSAGAFVEMLVRGIWGIDAHAQNFTCAPNINKLAEPSTWKLTNFFMGNSTWTVTHSGQGPTVTMLLDGSPVSGTITYPAAGTHTLAITASGRAAL